MSIIVNSEIEMKLMTYFPLMFALMCPVGAEDIDSTSSPYPTLANDAAFERYISAEFLAATLTSGTANELADAALQLAEGEKILLRTHHDPQISAAQLAAKVASASEDETVLRRISNLATASTPQVEESSMDVLLGDARSAGPTTGPEIDSREYIEVDVTADDALLDETGDATFSADLNQDEESLLGGNSRQFNKLLTRPGDWLNDRVNDVNNGALTSAGEGDNDVYICNRSSSTIDVAVAYLTKADGNNSFSRSSWVKKGWWTLRPGKKIKILSTRNRYVWFYARSQNGGSYGGTDAYHSIPNRRFSLPTRSTPADGKRVGFKRVNMGPNFVNFTYTFR